jgi:YD repeat-containing protein
LFREAEIDYTEFIMSRLSRLIIPVLVFFAALSFLPGQEKKEAGVSSGGGASSSDDFREKTGEFEPFPITPLLEAVRSGGIFWRPDWPLVMPPDAFMLLSGRFSSITVTVDSGDYALVRNESELSGNFPFLLNGTLAEARVIYDDAWGVKGFDIAAGIPLKVEFLEYAGQVLSLARITGGKKTCFVVFSQGNAEISETWYDEEGMALGVYLLKFTITEEGRRLFTSAGRYEEGEHGEWYNYDSWGNITEIDAPSGRFSALYNRPNRPHYWERRVFEPVLAGEGGEESAAAESSVQAAELRERFSLQWDERGFLVRMTGAFEGGNEEMADYRYEYTLDERGNWTERREIRMIRRFGLLVSGPGLTVKRIIKYYEDETRAGE